MAAKIKKNRDYRDDYDMPYYAKNGAFTISGQQLRKCLKGRNPFKHDADSWNRVIDPAGYNITQLKDGTWWVRNFRTGAPMFAPDFWWRIPNTAARRAKQINDFVEGIE